jgi:NAD(P)H dehydrogenase (quinone)
MILVTGATGNLGAATIQFLLKKMPAGQISALARDEQKAAGLKQAGVGVRIGDYNDYDSLVRAFAGVDKLLLVSSGDMNDRTAQHVNAINAAKAAGVKHVIYTGVEMRNTTSSAIQDVMQAHFDTVDYLKNSGLTYTILKNGLYADTLPMFIGPVVPETGIHLPAGEGRVAYATRTDMAEGAAAVLSSGGHENKEYAIVSDTTYSMKDIAEIFSGLSGKTIAYQDVPAEAYAAGLTSAGVPAEYIGFLSGFTAAIKADEFNLPSGDLARLLGRKPATLKDYLSEAYFA